MNKRDSVRTAIAAGVAGLCLSVGAVAMATADQPPSSGATAGAEAGDRGHGGPGFRHHRIAEDLAEALGLSEDKVADALEEVRDDLRPEAREDRADGARPERPTDEERAAAQERLAAALAEELGISTDKVTAALDELHDAREAEGRTELGERLDQAVADGDLTAADKASVLKAFDAGVLGGPGRHAR